MGRRERRRESKKKYFMSGLLIFLMVVSVAGVFLGSPSGSQGGFDLSYGDYDFEIINGYYVTEVNGRDRRFNMLPLDTLSIDVPPEASAVLDSSVVVVVTFNPESEDLQGIELAKFQFENNLDKTVYAAVTKESEVYPYPIVECQNATPDFPVILLEKSNTTQIEYDNGCVKIQGTGIDLVKAGERIIYSILGVIDE